MFRFLSIQFLMLTLLGILCFGTLFLESKTFLNYAVTPKWYLAVFTTAILIVVCCIRSICYTTTTIFFSNIIKISLWWMVIASGILAIQGILQFFGILTANGIFRVTGSFDNPAGFAICLSAGFPTCYYHWSQPNKWGNRLSIVVGLLIILAVILSGSRTGVFCLVVLGMLYILHYFSISIKTKQIFILTGILLGFICFLYLLKKDSADGRLLIWNCSWNMIMDKPWTGFGFGGFRENYMYYQAAYFRQFPDSPYAMLAGNVSRPFNEYILLLVNFGLLGLLVLIVCIYGIVRLYRRNKSPLTLFAVQTLIGIAVLALFSYPLLYPYIWWLLLLSVSILLIGLKDMFHLSRRKQRVCALLSGIATLMICTTIYRDMRYKQAWTQTINAALHAGIDNIKERYEMLFPKLKENHLFLFNYAAEMNHQQEYMLSLDIAKLVSDMWADYDLQLIMAHNYQQLEKYKEAEFHYRLASEMCPTRFVPLYGLLTTYESTGEVKKATEIASLIIEKPVKVQSSTVDRIKKIAMEWGG